LQKDRAAIALPLPKTCHPAGGIYHYAGDAINIQAPSALPLGAQTL